MRDFLFLLFLTCGLILPLSANNCILDQRLPRGFPADFTLCWSDPNYRVGSVNVINLLGTPETYQFLRYGNPITGVFLNTKIRKSRLLVYSGRIYLEIDPTWLRPESIRGEVERFQIRAGQVWDERHEFLDSIRAETKWRIVTGSPGRFRIDLLEKKGPNLTESVDLSQAAAPDAGTGTGSAPTPGAETNDSGLTADRLRAMSNSEIIDGLAAEAPDVVITGRGIRVPENAELPENAEGLIWELTRRFEREALSEIQQATGWPVTEGDCQVHCYDIASGNYTLYGTYPPKGLMASGWTPDSCEYWLMSGPTCY
ncbi:MAG: hypothetical protein HYT79_12205 [Elusimicrobia bacterium]|nr:hypothetical protein [Elusimicrobiota bacterium]